MSRDQYELYTASYGLTDEQKAFQKVALDFAENEMKLNMRTWDEKVCTYQ